MVYKIGILLLLIGATFYTFHIKSEYVGTILGLCTGGFGNNVYREFKEIRKSWG